MRNDYDKIQNKLRDEGTVQFTKDVKLKYVGEWSSLEPGDTYVAERNQGPQLLTVDHVNLLGAWVNPVETAYLYDLAECVKVEVLID